MQNPFERRLPQKQNQTVAFEKEFNAGIEPKLLEKAHTVRMKGADRPLLGCRTAVTGQGSRAGQAGYGFIVIKALHEFVYRSAGGVGERQIEWLHVRIRRIKNRPAVAPAAPVSSPNDSAAAGPLPWQEFEHLGHFLCEWEAQIDPLRRDG